MANTIYKRVATYDDIIKHSVLSVNAKIKSTKELKVGQVLALLGDSFVPVFQKASTHPKDEVVFKDGKLYKSKKADNASDVSVSTDWDEINGAKLGVLNDFINDEGIAGVLLIGRIKLDGLSDELKLALLKDNISVE